MSEAEANISVCLVTSARASLFSSNSGLAEPTNLNASNISVADFRIRIPDSSTVVAIFFASFSSQAMSFFDNPVKASTSAVASSRLFLFSRSWFSLIDTPVMAAIAVATTPMYLFTQSAERLHIVP